MKSERLRKYENELRDLEQWLDLGLVPKKDIEKHESEITVLQERIEEEKSRLRLLKENGEDEMLNPPRRAGAARSPYQEPPTMPGMDFGTEEGSTDAGLDMATESYDSETTYGEHTSDDSDDEHTVADEEEDDPFSDKNRWKRGILEDPESGDW